MPLKNQKIPNLPPKKTLSELADEYEQQIPVLEEMLANLKQEMKTTTNRKAVARKIYLVEDSLCEVHWAINQMRSYYEND